MTATFLFTLEACMQPTGTVFRSAGVYFFGKRKPDIPKLQSWRKIIKELNLTFA